MDRPLGHAIGNALATREALDCLVGNGPDDLAEVTCALVGEMLVLGGLAPDPGAGAIRAAHVLARGGALDRMATLVSAQGGDPAVVLEPARLERAPEHGVLEAPRAGWIRAVEPRALGYGVMALGGARGALDDALDPRVGFVVHVAPGDRVESGQPMGEVHAANPSDLLEGLATLQAAVDLGPEPGPSPLPLICGRVSHGTSPGAG
jgi:thymidine phosphorylase